VWFKAASLYAPISEPRDDCFVYVRTHAHKGAHAMCKLHREKQEPYRLCFVFQRQRYEYIPPQDADAERDEGDDVTGLGKGNGYIRLMKCPVKLPVAKYHASHGLDDTAVTAGKEVYGQNTLMVATPSFVELYKQQMVSPLVVFQFFTAFLWLLDEYWQFVLMQLGMILVLESATVFQRIKTFSTLNSMSSKPYKIQVFRNQKWDELSSLELLPGDLISVREAVTKVSAAVALPSGPADKKSAMAAKGALEESTGIVPCDCVLLHGAAVLNEASLTGESVPQMKDGLQVAQGEEDTPLSFDGAHRTHALFSGTQVISCHGPDKEQGKSLAARSGTSSTDPRHSPDGGCVCYVVRTGFNSSQGKMIQMIEYSQHQMTDDSKETGYALLVLLAFALIAAGYVLRKGLEKGDRTTHELLIKCVIIITSTVPKQLPMQMAMAVNTALMGLMKNGVFCTEPYRVPLAGKVNACLFDKTGTLTTDQLVLCGMMNPSGQREVTKNDVADSVSCALKPGDTVTVDGVTSKPELNGETVQVRSTGKDGRVEVERSGGDRVSLKRSHLRASLQTGSVHNQTPDHGLFSMSEACLEAQMVVAGCHALVEVGGNLMGDPIELEALKGMEWHYEATSNTARPGNWVTTEKAIENLLEQIKKLPAEDTERKATMEKQVEDARTRVSNAKSQAAKSKLRSVKIIHRHHFSPKLQRMSVVAYVDKEGFPRSQACLVKGSPEAVHGLLAPGLAPEWYERTYRELAERGLRVLALGFKCCDGTEPQLIAKETPPRDWVESGLSFAGFVAFGCKTRSDSATVLRSLMGADIATHMLTGDAPLTALHVAKEVSICSKDSGRACLLLEALPDNTVQWVRAIGEDRMPQPFRSPGVVELSRSHDLMVTEMAMTAAAEASNGELWKEVCAIQVFARMSPDGKASVIRSMQKHSGACVFMCGDGGNDVGALKQADVGLALLSGYGNTNTSDEFQSESQSGDPSKEGCERSAEDELNSQQALLAKRAKASQKLMAAEMKKIQAEMQAKQKQQMMDQVQAATARGEGVMAAMKLMKESAQQFRAELVARQKEVAAKYGSIYDKDKTANLLKEEMEAEMRSVVVRPGDASTAAPFTSRAPSVRNMVDIVRQGRCTLLSALQNQQIMMLECIITAYTLSALSVEGARSSERQMMASSWMLMIASMAFAFATPIDNMSKIRPLSSLFHRAVFVSMLGQAAIHLGCMRYASKLAIEEMGPAALKDVVDFHKKQKMIRQGQMCKDGSIPLNATAAGCPPDPSFEDDWKAWALSMLNTPFLPNLLNTVLWLVETAQMCAVTFVNYKGRPWMKGIVENHPLFLASLGCILMVAMCAWEVLPQLNELIHLAPFPDDAFRWQVMTLVFMSFGGTFIWDRLCIAVFAPEIMSAMVANAKETTWEDVMSVVRTLGKIGVCLAVYLSGNPLIWIGAFWYYRKQKQQADAREAAADA